MGIDLLMKLIVDTYNALIPVLLTWIVYMLKQSNKKRDANCQGTMVLLQIKLIEYHDKYCKQGHIPSYVYKNFCNMYNAYVALGGNDMVTKMKHEIDSLEIHQ